jgi:SRSO17 transposase
MGPRFQVRLRQVLTQCHVAPAAFRGIVRRLEAFAERFAGSLPSPQSRQHFHTYISGLLSDLGRKSTEAIAYRHELDRQVLQRFVGYLEWDHEPMLDELTRQVAQEIGEPDAVLVFDPSAFRKWGRGSVGVQRQWCGRLGKTENCQLGVYLGYVSRKEHALVDVRLYLPEEWAGARTRRKACRVPSTVRHRTRHQLALEMLDRRGTMLPHGWITGDDEMGRPTWFRRALNGRGERYLLAVPSNTTIRDLDATAPAWSGKGKEPKAPFVPLEAWCDALVKSAWKALRVREASKGPLELEIATGRVETKQDRRVTGYAETLVVMRRREADGTLKHDFYLSNADRELPLKEWARVAHAEHRIEECLRRSKGEAGLAQYQTRTWPGWYHHQTLSLLASWFLIQETRRGGKNHPRADGAPGAHRPVSDPASRDPMRPTRADRARTDPLAQADRTRKMLSLQSPRPTPASAVRVVTGHY